VALAAARRRCHPELRLDGSPGRQRADQLLRQALGPRPPGSQAHVQRVRGAGRHRAHLPAIHGALPLRSAAEHPARPRAGCSESRRLVHQGLLAHRVSALASRDLRRLPTGLRARRELVRDSGAARRVQSHHDSAAGRADRHRCAQLAGRGRSGRHPLRRLARLHRALLQADEPRHAGALGVTSRRRLARVGFVALIALLYGFLVAPIVIVVAASLNAGRFLVFPPAGLSLQWYVKFLNSEPFVRSFFFSLRLAALTTIITTVIGTAAALYVVRYAPPKDALPLPLVPPLHLPSTI